MKLPNKVALVAQLQKQQMIRGNILKLIVAHFT